MSRVYGKFILKLLTTEQKNVLIKIPQESFEMVTNDENVYI